MITVTATAQCLRCPWTTGPGSQADIDRLAEKHTRKTGHLTATSAGPATETTAADVAAAAQKGTT